MYYNINQTSQHMGMVKKKILTMLSRLSLYTDQNI